MYEEIAVAGGIAKPVRQPKPKKRLRNKTRLKTHYQPIPKEIKKAVLEEKGRLCFLGFCPVCGGQAAVGMDDDFHHFPHKSKGGKDCVIHLWPARRECHDYIQTHPREERMMFNEIEAAGIQVVWKVQIKGIGVQLREKTG